MSDQKVINTIDKVRGKDAAKKNLSVLLQYDDQLFIEQAYLQLLKRKPDTAGLDYYLKRIRSGVSKIEIIVQLLSSEEVEINEESILSYRMMFIYARLDASLRKLPLPKASSRYIAPISIPLTKIKKMSEHYLASSYHEDSLNFENVKGIEPNALRSLLNKVVDTTPPESVEQLTLSPNAMEVLKVLKLKGRG